MSNRTAHLRKLSGLLEDIAKRVVQPHTPLSLDPLCNFLTAVINFAQREYAADEFAAHIVGLNHALDALRKMKEFQFTVSVALVAPGVLGFNRTEFMSQSSVMSLAYDVFFTPYIPFCSHPGINDRIRHLEAVNSEHSDA